MAKDLGEFNGHPRSRYLCNIPKSDIIKLVEERGFKRTTEPEKIEYGYKIYLYEKQDKRGKTITLNVKEQTEENTYCPVGNISEVRVYKNEKGKNAWLWGGLESKL